jgi:hypothetical protein
VLHNVWPDVRVLQLASSCDQIPHQFVLPPIPPAGMQSSPKLAPGHLRSFVLLNQLDEPLRVVVAYNVTEVRACLLDDDSIDGWFGWLGRGRRCGLDLI